ncbi:hypothetical protein [Streptomyces yangpuensis]|uniref:hypothetical protein n=1 Tax=Streptomyces yangpuensis TaxID=1648182 RepID=UPI000629590D|nr:hypothetical protein [Streptomyces yangpuensis]
MTNRPVPPAPQWGPRPEGPSGASGPTAATGPRRPHRVFFWVFLAVQVFFLIWVIGALGSADADPEACAELTGDALQICRDAGDVGTAIGVGLLIALWAAVDVILATTTYGIYRLGRRQRS